MVIFFRYIMLQGSFHWIQHVFLELIACHMLNRKQSKLTLSCSECTTICQYQLNWEGWYNLSTWENSSFKPHNVMETILSFITTLEMLHKGMNNCLWVWLDERELRGKVTLPWSLLTLFWKENNYNLVEASQMHFSSAHLTFTVYLIKTLWNICEHLV